MPKLSVHLVAWNGAKYIPYLFESLRKQTYKDWELLAIDNGSKDGTADLIEQELKSFPVPAQLVRNEKNLGFAGGHNQAVRLSGAPPLTPPPQGGEMSQFPLLPEGEIKKGWEGGVGVPSEYIQLLNQDMYLAPDYFARVVAMMEAHPEAGAGQGLLLRWHNPTQPPLNLRGGEEGLSDLIDTMGLKVMRSRRVVDWRTGKNSKVVISTEAKRSGEISSATHKDGVRSLDFARDDERVVEVFGVSGALPVYRRKAVEDVMFQNQMFDEDFFSYKEDVDLAFRLRAAGWKAYVVPEAKAWHDRTAAGPREISDRAALENRRTKSAFINYHSYKNHLMVLLKNEHRANFVHDWPAIVWYELEKFVYLLFTDWGTLKGLREVCRLWKRTMEKRKFIMTRYRAAPHEMRRWFL